MVLSGSSKTVSRSFPDERPLGRRQGLENSLSYKIIRRFGPNHATIFFTFSCSRLWVVEPNHRYWPDSAPRCTYVTLGP